MLRKVRIALATVFFICITLLFLDFTGVVHLYLGWMAKIQFIPAVLALNFGVVAGLLLLTLLFFSMAHVMTACFVPDHFALSLFLLALTALAAGTLMAEDRRMPAWLTALLATITAGVTLTNAAKTWLAAWWTNGKAFWNWQMAWQKWM